MFRGPESKMTEHSNNPIVSPDSALEESPSSDGREKRTKVRYAFVAAAEIRDLRTTGRVSGRCSDLSLDGCYVDTLSPFPGGSIVQILVQHGMREFQAVGVVAYAHPSMGMGLKFMNVDPMHQDVLRHWISGLSGEESPGPAEIGVKIAPEAKIRAREMDPNIGLVLSELVALLVRKKILTESEGAELLPKIIS